MDIEKYEEKIDFSTVKINSGLSLIELMVVLVIIAILFGLGFMNYRDYARKQTVGSAARQVESDVRLARQMAFEGHKPSGCDVLNGYQFVVNADNTYDITAKCVNGDYPDKDDVAFASGGLTLGINPATDPNEILFKSVGDGVVITKNGVINNSVTNINVVITQDATGYNAALNIGTSVKVTPSY